MNIQWPRYLPRAIPGFAMHNAITGILRRDPGFHKMLPLARQIYRIYRVTGDYRDVLQRFLDLCRNVDKAKIQALGIQGSTVASNLLQRILGLLSLKDYPVSQESMVYLDRLVLQAKDSNDPYESWFSVKLIIYQAALRSRAHTIAYTQAIDAGSDPEILELAKQKVSVEEARQSADELMGMLNELRRFGVKASYFQDGMMHHPDDAWVFYDFQDFRTIGFKPGDSLIAITTLAPKKEIEPRPSLKQKLFRKHYAASKGAEITGTFSWSINSVGELDYSPELPLGSVREIFSELGKEWEYEQLRTAHALRLFDLVTAVDVVRQLPPIIPGEKTRKELKDWLKGGKEPAALRDLILPRIRYIEDRSRATEDLERELDEAEKETRRRQVREHSVTYFVRNLPLGRYASPEAVRRALDVGIVLKDGETFVRSHKRGKGNPPIAGARRAKHRKRRRK